MAPAPGPYTVEMWEQIPDDGNRYELLDGELIVTNAPIPRHQLVVLRLSVALHAYVTGHRLGVTWPGGDVHFDRYTVLEPDILVGLDPELVRLPSWKELPDPALVVEVLSPSSARHDRGRKRERYFERTAEYWIVDADARTVEVWRRGAARAEVPREALVWRPRPGVPALTISLAELFAGLEG